MATEQRAKTWRPFDTGPPALVADALVTDQDLERMLNELSESESLVSDFEGLSVD